MKIAALVARILLGTGFLIFGLNMLIPFLPQPPIPPDSFAGHFMAAAVPSHFMSLVGLFQVAGGALVLFGGTAPLGLLLLAPILVNILGFHVFLTAGEGLGPGLVFSALEAFLLYAYRGSFRGILTTSARPAAR